MADQESTYIIRLLLEAKSALAPVLESAAQQSENLQKKLDQVSRSATVLGQRLDSLDRNVSKTRDTLRSINPALDALDRNLTKVNASARGVAGGLDKMTGNLGKLDAALGSAVKMSESLEKRLTRLEEKLGVVGSRTARPRVELDGDQQAEVEIDRLLLKLRSLERQRARMRVELGLDQTPFDRGVAEVQAKIDALGGRDRRLDFQARIDTVQMAVDERRVRSAIARIKRDADALDRKRIGIWATLRGAPELKASYAKLRAELAILGKDPAEIKVRAKMDPNTLEILGRQFRSVNAIDVFPRWSTILEGVIATAILAIDPLLSTLDALAGAFIAVGSAALSAAGGLAGFAAAGVAQALPVAGLLFAALQRVSMVMKAVQANQAQKDKAAYQDTTLTKQQAGATDQLANAHRGVTDAMRALVNAQEALTVARREGIRTLQDLVLAEQRADLAASGSRVSLAETIASGGDVLSAQLQAQSDQTTAARQRVDTGRALRGGVSGLPAVKAAAQAVTQAREGVQRANEALAQAGRSTDFAAQRIGAADRNLSIALSHLDPAEKALYRAVVGFQNLFMPGGALTGIVDPMIRAFTGALDRFVALLKSPVVLGAATSLAGAIGGAIEQAARFFTSGPMKQALPFFTQQAAQNLPAVEKIFQGVSEIFVAIARAASGSLGVFLDHVSAFFVTLGDQLNTPGGQSRLAKFFDQALGSLQAFWDLFRSFVGLFAALMGPGGGVQEGDRAVEGLASRINAAAQYVRQHAAQVHAFLHQSIDVMRTLFGFVVDLGKLLVRVFDSGAANSFFVFLSKAVLPLLGDVVQGMGKIASVLTDVATWAPLRDAMRFIGDTAAVVVAMTYALKAVGWIVTGLGKVQRLLSGGGINSLFGGMRGQTPANPMFVEVVNQIPGGGGGPVGGAAGEGEASAGSALARVLRFAIRAAPWIVAADALVNADAAGQTPAQERRGLASVARSSRDMGFQGGQYGTLTGLPGSQLASTAKDNAAEIRNERQELEQLNAQITQLRQAGAADWMISGFISQRDQIQKTIGQWQDYGRQITSILTGRVKQTLRETEGNFEGMRIETRHHLSDIVKATQGNMRTIAHELGTQSAAGKEALAQNYKDAADQIKQSMDDGLISTKTGMQKIDDLLSARLQLYGFTKQEAHKFNQITNVEANRGNAEGGWIGKAGERGKDLYHTVLGRGEAVLNWAQQRAVNAAMAGRDTLDGIFARTRGQHAGGAYAPGFASGFFPAPGTNYSVGDEPEIARRLERLAKALGLDLTGISGYRTPQHSVEVGGFANDPHTRGQASDTPGIEGVPESVLERFGLTRPFSGAREADHIQLLGSVVRAVIGAGAARQAQRFRDLPFIKTVMQGLLGANVQGAVDLNRAAANEYLRRVFDRTSGGPGAVPSGARGPIPNVRGRWSVAQIARLWDSVGGPPAIDTLMGRIAYYGESGGDPNAYNPSGASGLWQILGQLVPGDIFKPRINALNAVAKWKLQGLIAWAGDKIFESEVRGKRPTGPGQYGRGGYVWGGAQARGGDYVVSSPTMFLAGDNGPEVASFTPLASGGKTPDPITAITNSKFGKALGDLVGMASVDVDFADVARLVGTIIHRLSSVHVGTRHGLDKLAAAFGILAQATTDVISNMVATVEGRATSMRAAIQARVFSGGRRHALGNQRTFSMAKQLLGTGAPQGLVGDVAGALGSGQADLGVISAERAGLVASQGRNQQLMAQAQRELAAAQRHGDKKAEAVAKGAINKAKANAQDISGKLAQNAQDSVERREQMQSEIYQATSDFFTRYNATITRIQRVNQALGLTQNAGAVFDAQIQSAQQQVSALQSQLAGAKGRGNTKLAQQIQDQIDDLNTTITETTAAKLADAVTQVENAAQRDQTKYGLQDRMASLKEKAGDAQGAFADRAATLASRGQSITSEISALTPLLAQAQAQGNQGMSQKLTDEIADLNVQLQENSEAIKENTTAARQAKIDTITGRGGFLSGVYGGLNNLVAAIGAASSTGVANVSQQRATVQNVITTLGQTGGALADQLYSIFGVDLRGKSPSDLVDALNGLNYDGIEANLSPADRDQFRGLINSIIDNATAVETNTQTLNSLNSSLTQAFSSTAWTRFRQAIFNGNNGLLPQYQMIPSLDVGGVITQTGLVLAHTGERLVPASVVKGGDGASYGDTNITINEAGSPVDITHLASRLSFERTTKR